MYRLIITIVALFNSQLFAGKGACLLQSCLSAVDSNEQQGRQITSIIVAMIIFQSNFFDIKQYWLSH